MKQKGDRRQYRNNLHTAGTKMKYTKTQDGRYLIKMEIGDRVVEALNSLGNKLEIKSGTISGIGAIKDPLLGYFDIHNKKYIEKKFKGDYELLSLAGNIAEKEGKLFFHIHVVLGDENFNTIGGHLMETEVAVTTEIIIIPADYELKRGFDEETQLWLWKLQV